MNKPIPPKWSRLVLWELIGVLGLMASVLLALWLYTPNQTLASNPFVSPEMAAARYAPSDVVGDLGGMPVTIPRYFADHVEYNGDPGWGEKRKGSRPERTHISKLTSFGFKVRFPDMQGLSSSSILKDKEGQNIFNTMWIGVGLLAGESYPGDGFLDRRASYIQKPDGIVPYERYERLPDQQHGLTVYAATGTDPKTNEPYREHRSAQDIFVHRDKNGRVDAYITCSNRPHNAAPCRHDFSMEPSVGAQVYVSYRRGLLPEWQQIQTSVTELILGFKAGGVAPTATPVVTKP